jgi:metal-responsive CopG/Arc/MetJ family transcriptional regulator
MEKINEKRFIAVCITLRKDLVEKADKVVRDGMIDGINNRSALIDYALAKVFKELFKEQEKPKEA